MVVFFKKAPITSSQLKPIIASTKMKAISYHGFSVVPPPHKYITQRSIHWTAS